MIVRLNGEHLESSPEVSDSGRFYLGRYKSNLIVLLYCNSYLHAYFKIYKGLFIYLSLESDLFMSIQKLSFDF